MPGVPTANGKQAALPLRYTTPPAWVAQALAEPLALLADHAQLERKAAVNALDLVNRWPRDDHAEAWVGLLAAITADEAMHLKAVTRLLAARGGAIPRAHRNAYASALHERVRRGDGPRELLDRLLVAALIEARSCERFELLAAHGEDAELAAFFAGLCASERGHYTVFLRLADMVGGRALREARWHEWLDLEAAVIAAQPPGPRIHSGLAP
ncbi:MAG: tRNA isopentenyl-2-thiomethyl-A-37 hydroxylase MiaE [Gammaproteobacteria bacterium]